MVRAVRLGEARVEEIHVSEHDAGGANPAGRARLPQLVFILHGNLHMRHRGNLLHLDSSGWSIVDPDQCSLAAEPGTRALVVSLPDLQQMAGITTVHPALRGVGTVLLNLARTTLDAAPHLNEQALAEIGHAITELARQALREDAGQQPRLPARAILCERIKTFVRRHLHQSHLTIDYIAQSFHCTKRHLHKVFGDSGISLNQFIWGLRLERCAQDLANPAFNDRSVIDIAFSWGFTNSSHFSRAFRQRFGMPPSAYRARPTTGNSSRMTHQSLSA